jgi:four helix bundle protein
MFDHEKLDVYNVSIQFVGWSYILCKKLIGIDRHARDQLIRAAQSIPLNIAEGNGKLPSADRQRYLRIARGSALECAAILDVLNVCSVISLEDVSFGKGLLVRIVSMLSKMTTLPGQLREESEYGYEYDYEYENKEPN